MQYKKSILTGIGFLFFIAVTKGQTLENARRLWLQNDLARAKAAIDSFTQQYPQQAAGWLLQANIAYSIAAAPQWQNLLPDGYMEAFYALSKAAQANPSFTDSILNKSHYELPQQLYDKLSAQGVATFNTAIDQKDRQVFKTAFAIFRNANRISFWLHEKNENFPALDTANLYYSTMAAINAEDESNAILLAQKTALYNIATDSRNLDWKNIYQWLVYQYRKENNAPYFLKYAALGKSLFPASDYFTLSEIDWYRQRGQYKEMMNAYQNLFATFGKQDRYMLAYGGDWLNAIYNNHSGIAETYKERDNNAAQLIAVLINYLKNNPGSTTARLILAKTFINRTTDAAKQKAKAASSKRSNQQHQWLQSARKLLNEIVEQFPSAERMEAKELLGKVSHR
ncbi:MAG: hypothetical protein JST86_14055 [Bacteroidetes bacterium]|nr:hypothetical protein [Bacteroidota bacterium]